MKKLMITVAMMATMVVAKAQNYWVLETDSKKISVVRVYDSNNKLLSESKLEKRINIARKKHRRMLDKLANQNTELPVWSKR